jgi:hypothetical protein
VYLHVPSNTQMCKFRLVPSNVSRSFHLMLSTGVQRAFYCCGDGAKVCWVMFCFTWSSPAHFVTPDYVISFVGVQFNLQGT